MAEIRNIYAPRFQCRLRQPNAPTVKILLNWEAKTDKAVVCRTTQTERERNNLRERILRCAVIKCCEHDDRQCALSLAL